MRDHFFTRDEVPHLGLVVTYHLMRPEEGAGSVPAALDVCLTRFLEEPSP